MSIWILSAKSPEITVEASIQPDESEDEFIVQGGMSEEQQKGVFK